MTVSKPNRGAVIVETGAPTFVGGEALGDAGDTSYGAGLLRDFARGGYGGLPRGREHLTRSGRWRPDAPFTRGDGIKVTMRAIKGVTPDDVLMVPLRFQVPPLNEFARKWGTTWQRYSTLGAGERARSPERPLFEQSFATMLMDGATLDDHLPLAVWTGDPDPQRLLEELRWIMGRDRRQKAVVFRLTMTQTGLWPGSDLVNMPCALTDLQASQKPGEPGTEYVDLTFLEVPDENLEVRGKKSRATASDRTRNVPVKDGEDLHAFARRAYRSAAAWTAIRDANGITGVAADSPAALKRWLKRHNKTALKVPALGIAGGSVTVGKGLR